MLTRDGKSVTALAKEMGVTTKQLYAWQARYREVMQKAPSELSAENERLRREIAQLREERDVLKKATAFFVRASR
jgi:transposase